MGFGGCSRLVLFRLSGFGLSLSLVHLIRFLSALSSGGKMKLWLSFVQLQAGCHCLHSNTSDTTVTIISAEGV